jgi:hypothetical protein
MQEIKFTVHLNLSESYIYGTATIDGKDYSINIQQAAKQMIVLPPEFSHIGELDKAIISFSRDNDKKMSVPSQIHIGQGDLIEVYLDQDDLLFSLANNLPMEITISIV